MRKAGAAATHDPSSGTYPDRGDDAARAAIAASVAGVQAFDVPPFVPATGLGVVVAERGVMVSVERVVAELANGRPYCWTSHQEHPATVPTMIAVAAIMPMISRTGVRVGGA